MQVTLVEHGPHVLRPLDDEMAKMVESELVRSGVTLALGVGVSRFETSQPRYFSGVGGRSRAQLRHNNRWRGCTASNRVGSYRRLTIGASGGVAV